jgi:hypothetical protein
MSTSEVRAKLGKPNRIVKRLKDSYFYLYFDPGIDLDFRKSRGALQIIFFYGAGIQGHRRSEAITDRGVELGDSLSKVLSLYGPPDRKGPIRDIEVAWIYYDEGIQFNFDADRLCTVISISRPTTKAARK